MEDFAKLYDDTRHGQVLVKLDTDPEDGNPEIRFYARLPGAGVCSLAIGFTDDDEGWDKAEHAFSEMGSEFAERVVDQLRSQWDEMTGGDV